MVFLLKSEKRILLKLPNNVSLLGGIDNQERIFTFLQREECIIGFISNSNKDSHNQDGSFVFLIRHRTYGQKINNFKNYPAFSESYRGVRLGIKNDGLLKVTRLDDNHLTFSYLDYNAKV